MGLILEGILEAFRLMDAGHTVEVPRKKGIGSRPAPNPEDAAALKTLQGRFTGLLLDAVRRQAPLQEWCVVDGYPPLVHNPWATLYVQRAAQDREKQLIELTLQP